MESYRECKIESGGVLDEVTEVIKLPSFNSRAYKGYVDPESIELDPLVLSQLRRYVTIIAAMVRILVIQNCLCSSPFLIAEPLLPASALLCSAHVSTATIRFTILRYVADSCQVWPGHR
jgi:hypothetical protein